MDINFGLISTYSNFDRLYQNNKKLFSEISKSFSKFYVISLENIITPNKGVVKSKNLQICAGESLLRRVVNLALEIAIDSRVIVSTDSEDYIEHVSDLECSNHFLRYFLIP